MSNDTIIREVDEELRRDRLRNFWRHGGPWVIVAAVLIVVGVAGYEGWMWWTKTQSAKFSDQFYAAAEIADGTDVNAAKKALDDVIAQTAGGYPMLAQFREASLLSQNGKTDDAVAAYDALSTSLGNTHLRELALILAGNLLVDKGDVNAVEQRVGGSITPADPLRNAAREVLGLTQYKAGKLDDAMKNFSDIINDPLSSQDLRNRIQLYTLQLLAEGAKPIAPPSPDQPVVPPSEPSSAPVSSEAPVASSSEASASSSALSSSAASSAPASSSEASSAVSSALSSSAAVDESTELDVTPPTVLDDNLMSMAMPGVSSSAAEAPVSASSTAPESSSVAPITSSSIPPVASSSVAPVSSSAPLASSSLAPISSSAP